MVDVKIVAATTLGATITVTGQNRSPNFDPICLLRGRVSVPSFWERCFLVGVWVYQLVYEIRMRVLTSIVDTAV